MDALRTAMCKALIMLLFITQHVSAQESPDVDKKPLILIESAQDQANQWAICSAAYESYSQLLETVPESRAQAQQLAGRVNPACKSTYYSL